MILTLARLLASAASPIPDCDEVFNFWEPTHFVTHGSGLQTWEWSPVYAIRSWAYVHLHALILAPLACILPEKYLFYALRACFALFEAYTEYKLVKAIKKYDTTAAWSFGALSAACTGLFHASVAYLPSSFGMYFVTLAAATFLEDQDNITRALFYIAVGGLLGWPFVLLLALPIGLYFTMQCTSLTRWLRAVTSSLQLVALVLAAVVAVDSWFYQKLVVVPFNIVAYNVLFASEDAGPEIFGVEPWTYYGLNLALNFHVLVPIAFALPLFENRGPVLSIWAMVVLWVGTLTATPHKEERFLYPVYPLIVLCASFSLARVWKVVNSFTKLPRAIFSAAIVSICAVSILRSLALAAYYTAPMRIYDAVEPNSTVCYGREWYRFPSSYLVQGAQPRFIKSGFDGMLPGVFESMTAIPEGMNNKNLWDPSKIIDVEQCDYIVEMDTPVNTDAGEWLPDWERTCARFIDIENTPTISRLLYTNYNTKWVDYCLYKRS